MIIALIPARYDSTRLPGKPLLKFNNKTMIQMVYLQTKKSKYIDHVYVVCDDDRIKDSIDQINGDTLLIKDECLNGTERICLAIKRYNLNADIIVNVQGDEPFINPLNINLAIEAFQKSKNKEVVCSTLCYQITDHSELTNRSIGKLALDKDNHILYCSRACIPANKKEKIYTSKYFAHIGVFVFNKNYLLTEYVKEDTPLQLEEDIEWLKILEQGYKIICSRVDDHEIGVNLPEDYEYLLNKYNIQ